jgi:hypothetical protein
MYFYNKMEITKKKINKKKIYIQKKIQHCRNSSEIQNIPNLLSLDYIRL